jgi:succinate-semialdehyde dehydrogenase/glutarate-semialdehyde dehydrogenase
MEDADLSLAAETAVKARMINTGQSCIAAKRFIIHEKVYEVFSERFIIALKVLKKGDPINTATDFGPLARKDLAEEIHQQVLDSVNKGTEIAYGELPASIVDAFYPPMVLQNIPEDAPAYSEEIFGPVACFFKCRDENDAIEIANNSPFGLGASLWTEDHIKARRMADRIESGAVYCNQMMFSDPSVPFGGVKTSGYGRELSHLGIREFTNQKTVWIA